MTCWVWFPLVGYRWSFTSPPTGSRGLPGRTWSNFMTFVDLQRKTCRSGQLCSHEQWSCTLTLDFLACTSQLSALFVRTCLARVRTSSGDSWKCLNGSLKCSPRFARSSGALKMFRPWTSLQGRPYHRLLRLCR